MRLWHVEAVVRGFVFWFDLNVAGFGESPLGDHWACNLIDENGEEDDITDQKAFCGA